MTQYQYIFQPYSGKQSRHICPKCGKPHQFTRYINTESGQILSDEVGKCNRVDKCAYHFTPKQYFDLNGTKLITESQQYQSTSQAKSGPISFIDENTFKKSMGRYDINMLAVFLNTIFNPEITMDLIARYGIGTSSRYGGGTTVFWQIDMDDKVRTGKLIKYDKNGHRIKGYNNWAHSVLKLPDYNLQQCLFGEHLLKRSRQSKVAVVESEKTAIIMAAVLPDLVWLASGGADGLSVEKVRALEGRKVILFPDASDNGIIYNKWEQKAKQFGFEISDYLEEYTNHEQRSRGVDIADLIISKKDKIDRI